MIIIRDIQAPDIEAVLALRERWLSEKLPVWNTTARERAWFARYPGNMRAPALVAVDGDRLIGYILCALMTHPAMPGVSAIIDEICVGESHRRLGVGRRLVDALRTWLRSTVDDLSVISARIDREDETARAFWIALGFEHHLHEFTDYLE